MKGTVFQVLKKYQRDELEQLIEDLDYTCGSVFADIEADKDSVLDSIYVKANLTCNSPIGIPHYTAGTAAICYHCGDELQENENNHPICLPRVSAEMTCTVTNTVIMSSVGGTLCIGDGCQTKRSEVQVNLACWDNGCKVNFPVQLYPLCYSVDSNGCVVPKSRYYKHVLFYFVQFSFAGFKQVQPILLALILRNQHNSVEILV